MFVQVIQGQVGDEAALRQQFDRWLEDLSPQAEGWLGATAGVTVEGEFLSVVRFASEDAARRNSDRPEQGEWWGQTEPHFAGAVSFRDYREAEVFLGGGSDDAGFVQIIQGRMTDVAGSRELAAALEEHLPGFRPEILGGLLAWADDGDFTQAIYFTSEEAARAGERRDDERPPALAQAVDEWFRLTEDLRYADLADPWLWSRS